MKKTGKQECKERRCRKKDRHNRHHNLHHNKHHRHHKTSRMFHKLSHRRLKNNAREEEDKRDRDECQEVDEDNRNSSKLNRHDLNSNRLRNLTRDQGHQKRSQEKRGEGSTTKEPP